MYGMLCVVESKCCALSEVTPGRVGNGIRTVNLLMLISLCADKLSIFTSALCWTVKELLGSEAPKVRPVSTVNSAAFVHKSAILIIVKYSVTFNQADTVLGV